MTLNTSSCRGAFFTNKNAGFDLKVIISGLTIERSGRSQIHPHPTHHHGRHLPVRLDRHRRYRAERRVADGTFDATIDVSHAMISGVLFTNEQVMLDTNGAIGFFNDDHAATGQIVLVFG